MKKDFPGGSASRPTQKDIAKGLNISLITVQRALRNSGYVSVEMKRRVKDYARKIGYKPDRAAQSLVRKSARKLIVISTEEPRFYWKEVEKGVEAASAQISDFGFRVNYIKMPINDTEYYLSELEKHKQSGLDGVILVNNLEYEMNRIFRSLDEDKIPYATLNIDAPTSDRKAFIGVNHGKEGSLAANFLALSNNEKKPLLMIASSSPRNTTLEGADIALERWTGFYQTAQENHISCHKLIINENHVPETELKRVGGIYLTSLVPGLADTIRKKTSLPIITGTNSPENRRQLRKGTIQAVICQNPVLQGYYAIKTMEQILEKERGEPVIIKLAHSLLLKENLDQRKNNLLLMS